NLRGGSLETSVGEEGHHHVLARLDVLAGIDTDAVERSRPVSEVERYLIAAAENPLVRMSGIEVPLDLGAQPPLSRVPGVGVLDPPADHLHVRLRHRYASRPSSAPARSRLAPTSLSPPVSGSKTKPRICSRLGSAGSERNRSIPAT